MEISPILLFYLLVSSLFLGVGVGFLYDVHRIVRIFFGVRYSKQRPTALLSRQLPFLGRSLGEIRQGKLKSKVLFILIFFQDVFLLAIAGGGVVILNYAFNDGQFRFYTVVALGLGFFIYYFTAGKLVIYLSEWIVFFLRATFSIFFFLLLRPFVIILTFLFYVLKKILANLEKSIAKHRKKVYNKRKTRDCFNAAERGFL